MKWTKDKFLPLWESEGLEDISILVRQHGKRRFNWSVSCDFQIEAGCDAIEGSALSLSAAKLMAEAAAKWLESEPIDWKLP